MVSQLKRRFNTERFKSRTCQALASERQHNVSQPQAGLRFEADAMKQCALLGAQNDKAASCLPETAKNCVQKSTRRL